MTGDMGYALDDGDAGFCKLGTFGGIGVETDYVPSALRSDYALSRRPDAKSDDPTVLSMRVILPCRFD